MQKHLIIEGPDGSGKTTLLEKVKANFPEFEQAPRASKSTEGPVADLQAWCDAITRNTYAHKVPKYWLMDRHPIISETIYAPSLGRQSRPGFEDPIWTTAQRRFLYVHAFVIFCLPPFVEVEANVLDNASQQMPGVTDNIEDLYQRYCTTHRLWGGPKMMYAYTEPIIDPLDAVQRWVA